MFRLLFILFLAIAACERPDPAPVAPVVEGKEARGVDERWTYFPDEFRDTSIRARAPDPYIPGNSREAFVEAARQGVRFAEADFRISKDNVIVSGHSDNLGGNCGQASKKTWEELQNCRNGNGLRIANLRFFLEVAYEEVYIDLKASADVEGATLRTIVEVAIEDILATNAQDKAVLMLYSISDEVIALLHEHDIRAGFKGYPETTAQTREMIEEAARHKMEMICVRTTVLDESLIHFAAEKGVWVLGWDLARDDVSTYVPLAAAGMGGLIHRAGELVAREVTPAWQDVRDFLTRDVTAP